MRTFFGGVVEGGIGGVYYNSVVMCSLGVSQSRMQ